MKRILGVIKRTLLYIGLIFVRKSNIHAKYSTRDKVYFVMNGKVMCARVSTIFIEIGSKDKIEYKVFPDSSMREWTKLFKEGELFSSREELIKSL